MREAFIVDAVRTPMGRHAGALASVRPDDLAAHVIRAIVARNSVPADQIDDVLWGAANQAGEDNRNVARMAALLAGLHVEVPGATVNRLCGSGLEAVNAGYRLIRKEVKELDTSDRLLLLLSTGRALDELETARLDLGRLPTYRRLVICPNGTKLELRPHDIGVGISQVVPVVVMALEGQEHHQHR